jgi:hypothetical protein
MAARKGQGHFGHEGDIELVLWQDFPVGPAELLTLGLQQGVLSHEALLHQDLGKGYATLRTHGLRLGELSAGDGVTGQENLG